MTREKELKADLVKIEAERDKANAEIARLKRLVTPPKKQNYTKKEIDLIKDVERPLTLVKAKELGKKLNRSHRSIISKAKDVGVPYKAEPRKPKGKALVNKVELINEILTKLKLPKTKRDYFSRKELLELHKRLVK